MGRNSQVEAEAEVVSERVFYRKKEKADGRKTRNPLVLLCDDKTQRNKALCTAPLK